MHCVLCAANLIFLCFSHVCTYFVNGGLLIVVRSFCMADREDSHSDSSYQRMSDPHHDQVMPPSPNSSASVGPFTTNVLCETNNDSIQLDVHERRDIDTNYLSTDSKQEVNDASSSNEKRRYTADVIGFLTEQEQAAMVQLPKEFKGMKDV